MVYVCIALFIIIVLLLVQIYLIYHTLQKASEQMEDIEKYPDGNRQLKNFSTNRKVEEHLNKINLIYKARQQERIIYQRRETQIRQEIENISHDLRTPLTSIIGYIDLVQDNETTNEEREEYLKIVSKRARVLQGFVQDFYEISRMEGEDYPLLLVALPVQNMLSETIVAYYHEFEKKKIQVEIVMEDKQSYIIADKIQFNRILNNLIQNALKYAGKQFTIKQYAENGKCILQFMNDKNQMSEEELRLIFNRFYTGDQNRNQGSTGLGLTITKILIEKLKGSIDARFDKDLFVIELQWAEKS